MKMKAKSKVLALRIGAFMSSITPILIAVGFNWQDYTATTTETIKLSAGSIILLIFMFLKSMGKLKVPEKRIIVYFIIFCLAYLMESIMYDIVLLSGMALLGEIPDMILEKQATKIEGQEKVNQQAEATAKQLNAIQQQQETSGRV